MYKTRKFHIFIIAFILLQVGITQYAYSMEEGDEPKNANGSPHLLSLPKEMITICLDYLDSESFRNTKQVCHKLYTICQEPQLLLPQDEEGLKLYLLNSFDRALLISGRGAVRPQAQRLIALEKNMREKNNHYIFSSVEACNASNISWELCYKALYLAAHIGAPQTQTQLDNECERKQRRLKKYKDYLRENDDEKVIHLFCWEQVAFFKEAERASLIESYQSGTNDVKQNLERAGAWKGFDWRKNSFSSVFKLA